jgi:hypothetical protein
VYANKTLMMMTLMLCLFDENMAEKVKAFLKERSQ